jgi:hypothetical protein
VVEKRRGGEKGEELFVPGPLSLDFPSSSFGKGWSRKGEGKAWGKGNSCTQVLSLWILPPSIGEGPPLSARRLRKGEGKACVGKGVGLSRQQYSEKEEKEGEF